MKSLIESELSPAEISDIVRQIGEGKAPIAIANDYYSIITADLLIKHNRLRGYIGGDNCTMSHAERAKLLSNTAADVDAYLSEYEVIFKAYSFLAESLAALKAVMINSLNAMKNHGFCLVSENLQ